MAHFLKKQMIWTPHLRAFDPDPSSGLERVSVPIENDHFDVKNVEGNWSVTRFGEILPIGQDYQKYLAKF